MKILKMVLLGLADIILSVIVTLLFLVGSITLFAGDWSLGILYFLIAVVFAIPTAFVQSAQKGGK